MKKYFTLFFLLPLFATSQNLLSNGGFEQYSSLPNGYCQWDHCTGWTNVNGSTGCGAYGTPDYYNTNAPSPVMLPKIANGDSINPHGGNGIMGFITIQVPPNIADYREYIMTQLNTPMVQGTTYQVSFYLSNAYNPTYGYGSNNIGLCFSNSALQQVTYKAINVVPQLEITTIVFDSNWVNFQFNYLADSAYQYLTIGNFRSDTATQRQNFKHTGNIAYYFIDDITVTPVSASPPVASFQASATTLCTNSCINFTNLSTNSTSWQWTFQGGTPSTSTDQNPQNICYISPGSFDVTLIASGPGGSDTLPLSGYTMVNSSPPAPVITQSYDTLFCNSDSTYSSYQWYIDTTLIPGATDTSVLIAQSGNYNIKVTSSNGCSSATGINLILGIRPFTANSHDFAVSPNPAANEIKITGTDLNIEKIEIYNVLGEKVYTKQLGITNQQQTIVMDVSSFPSGIYFIQALNEKNRWIGRFVKE